ncbi:glutamate formimidoyltransferase [bacterium]|nr:glutamate formimidoyltransferase [bacterium]
MGRKVVECVPNFSEGRDLNKIREITGAIEQVDGVELLDVDPGGATNRTVVTFIGSPEAVAEASFQAVKKASEVIDMREHYGAHARMGATDVCPFVPVSGVSMEDCVNIARVVGRRIGEELKIPVYLYEEAAASPERTNLANVRSGEYEGLAEKIKDPHWKPDFGPAEFNPRSGATAVGAREFLIAFNINLNTTDKRYATDIAFDLRLKGRSKRSGNIHPFYFKGDIVRYEEVRFPCGPCDFIATSLTELEKHYQEVHQLDLKEVLSFFEYEYDEAWLKGKPVKIFGMFDHCKAVGWVIEEYNRAQISINFTNYKLTPPHIVVEEARKLAARMGLIVTGCELVGLIPYPALLEAGKYYLQRQGHSTAVPYPDILEMAIQSLGLREVASFEVEKKVLGLPEPTGKLGRMPIDQFTDEVSRDSVAPGGGSIAALAGALGSALASMDAAITALKPEYEEVFQDMIRIGENAQRLKAELIQIVDRDTEAFNDVFSAQRLPASSPQEMETRSKAIEEGYKKATLVPFKTAELCFQALELCHEVARKGNLNSVSDAGVGAVMASAGVFGAGMNVLINFPNLKDRQFVAELKQKLEFLQDQTNALREEILSLVYSNINKLRKK